MHALLKEYKLLAKIMIIYDCTTQARVEFETCMENGRVTAESLHRHPTAEKMTVPFFVVIEKNFGNYVFLGGIKAQYI